MTYGDVLADETWCPGVGVEDRSVLDVAPGPHLDPLELRSPHRPEHDHGICPDPDVTVQADAGGHEGGGVDRGRGHFQGFHRLSTYRRFEVSVPEWAGESTRRRLPQTGISRSSRSLAIRPVHVSSAAGGSRSVTTSAIACERHRRRRSKRRSLSPAAHRLHP